MRIRSAPPSITPRICVAYPATNSSKLTSRAAGSETSADIEAVRFVGPNEPATNRGLSLLNSSATRRAIAAASREISYTYSSNP